MKKTATFILDFILWLIAYALTPFVELATLIVVIFKYRLGALNYFSGEAYSFDVRSASRNRSLWNFLFINSKGYRFKQSTKKSISWHIGVNSYLSGLSWVGWFMYTALFIIDISSWFRHGHCRACVNYSDVEIIKKQLQNGTRD